MLRLTAILLSVGLLGAGAYWYLHARADGSPPLEQAVHLPQQVKGLLEQTVAKHAGQLAAASVPSTASSATPPSTTHRGHGSAVDPTVAHAAAPPDATPVSANQVTLYLTNGGIVTAELARATPQEVILHWSYGDVAFRRTEIRRMVSGKQQTGTGDITTPAEAAGKIDWPYQHDVVVKLMKGSIVDGAITAVTPKTVTVTQTTPHGGTIEHVIQRAEIDQLLFRAIHNERSTRIAEHLRTVFPTMSWHDEGLFTIVTDSDSAAINEYRRTIRELATDWYLTFYPLAKEHQPRVQHYLVIFDDMSRYVEYALSDGVPGWLAVGYYNPDDQVLYCFNMLGPQFSELIYDAYLGQFRAARDQVTRQVKGSGYEETVDGRLSEFLKKLETAHAMARQLFAQRSTNVLRHELTHAMFHNWQLQDVTVSQLAAPNPAEAQKKLEYLKATDREKKRELLDELLAGRAKIPPVERQATNAWFVEGLAGYMEPNPVGDLNSERLAALQHAKAQRHMLPLEFLNAFRLGSFVGMATPSALDAYAQSWGFCHFLMQRHPEGFFTYLRRLAHDRASATQETLPWLYEALGTSPQPLEQEFLAYLDQFPPEDPFWLKQMHMLLDLRAELITLGSRSW